jgi:hypothetical protein
MATRSAIGEIRNGIVKAVFVMYDGDPCSMLPVIQRHIKDNGTQAIERFLSKMYRSSEWRNLDTPLSDAHSEIFFNSLEDIGKSWIEYAYLFNFDNEGVYVCTNRKNILYVLGGCKFEVIQNVDCDDLADTYDEDDNEVVLPEFTIVPS